MVNETYTRYKFFILQETYKEYRINTDKIQNNIVNIYTTGLSTPDQSAALGNPIEIRL